MDCQGLSHLIDAWELSHVEFKSRSFVRPLNDARRNALAAALASLANRGGGYLVIGVDDTSHHVEEGTFEDKDDLAGRIANVNRDLCSPPTEVHHSYFTCSGGEVLVLEIGKRGQIPHAVVKRQGGEIANRVYYTRNNQGKQLVVDTELRQMFLDADFPSIGKTFPFVYFHLRKGLLEPYFEDLQPWGINDVAFRTILPRIDTSSMEEGHSTSRLVAEVFPYSVLSVIDKSVSRGWGRHVTPVGLALQVEEVSEPHTTLTSNDVPAPPADSMLAGAVKNFHDLAKLFVFFDLTLPPKTDILVWYAQSPVPNSSLELRADGVYRISFNYWGGSWVVGLPPEHPHALRVYPEPLQTTDPYAWTLGHVDMSFEMQFGDYGPRALGDYYEWARRLLDLVEQQLSWTKYVERLPNPYLLRIDRNVQQVLDELQPDDEPPEDASKLG